MIDRGRRLSADRPGQGVHDRAVRRSPRSRTHRIAAGDVLVLMCRGPMGSGMEETYQLTGALKYLALRQACRRPHRRALQRRLDRRVHRPRDAGSAGRRADRQAARRRPDRDRHRSPDARRIRELRRRSRRGRCGRDDGSRILSARPLRPDLERRTPPCPPTRASGRRCRTSAAASGAAAWSTPTPSTRRARGQGGDGRDTLVACPRQLCSEFRSAAPGWQGATTENTGSI